MGDKIDIFGDPRPLEKEATIDEVVMELRKNDYAKKIKKMERNMNVMATAVIAGISLSVLSVIGIFATPLVAMVLSGVCCTAFLAVGFDIPNVNTKVIRFGGYLRETRGDSMVIPILDRVVQTPESIQKRHEMLLKLSPFRESPKPQAAIALPGVQVAAA